MEKLPALSAEQPTIGGILKKITEKPRAFLKVFLIHGRRGEKWSRQEGSTIPAKPAHWCGVVSASSCSSQPLQTRQGPCCV